MPEESTSRRTRIGRWIVAVAGLLLLAIVLAAAWYVRSPQFADLVRRKTIAVLEDATGGRVELGSFRWSLSHLQFDADNLTIHGLEPVDQLPYVHAARVHVQLRIISFLERQVDLRFLRVDQPVVHIIVNADGTTNAPHPKIRSKTNSIQQLIDLAIARAEVRNGTLVWNERKLPFDFSASDLAANVTYDRADRHYDGDIHVGKIDAQYQDFRDVAAQSDLAFGLWANRLQIRSLKLVSEKSVVEASGELSDFANPQVQFQWKSTLDAYQLGAITRMYQLRGGTIALNGRGGYSSEDGLVSHGQFAIKNLEYVEAGVALHDARIDADFSLRSDRLFFNHIAARLLGGNVKGDAEIANLGFPSGTPPTLKAVPGTKTKPLPIQGRSLMMSGSPVQQGNARLEVTGLSLAEMAKMLSTKAMPYEKLNPAGSVDGRVTLTWQRSIANADADLALEVSPPAQTMDAQVPVTATFRGRYSPRAQAVDFSTLDVATRHMRLTASGRLGEYSAALKLAVTATSLAEVQPFIVAMGDAPLPVELAGQAVFDGTLIGKLKAPEVAGHVQASDFTYTYVPTLKPAPHAPQTIHKTRSPLQTTSSFPSQAAPQPPQPIATARRIHIDQFSGDIHYSPSGISLHRGVIQEAKTHLKLDGSAALDHGNFTPTSEFQVQAAVQNADIGELQNAVGLTYPVSGILDFTMQAAGTQVNPHGSGHFSLTAAEAYGRPVKSLKANLAFADHEAQLHDIQLQALRGTIAGSAAYDWSDGAMHLDLTGQSISLAEFPALQRPRLSLTGIARFTAKGTGTLQQPVINAHVQIADLTLNGDRLGSLVADAVTHGSHLQLAAHSDFTKAVFSVEGGIELRGEMPGNLKLEFSNFDAGPFLPAGIRSRITHQSSLAGHAQLSGPLKQPHLLRGIFSIEQFSIEIQKVAISSDGPLELAMADQVISVQRCSLVSEDSHFSLTGSVSLVNERRLDLQANGHVNMKVAHVLDPDISSYGATDVNLSVVGPMENPSISGRVDIAHVGLSMIDLPSGLGDINGSLVFNQNRLEVEKLTARTGGGLVTFGGFITYGRTIGFNLTANGNEIRFRYAGVSVTADETLRLMGTLQNATLTGEVTVTRFAQIPSSDLQYVLAQASGPPALPNPNSPLNNLHLDVRIFSAPELTVQTTLAKLSGDVDLRLRGTAERPVLLGRINVAEGDIKLNGTKYHLERGDITFTNPVRIDPVLDVEATTRVRDYDITIGLHGTLERLNTTYRSDPPLSSDDIVALLAFGRTEQEGALNAAPSSGLAASATGAVLSQAINQTVGNRVQRLFGLGVSSIRINPSVGGPDNNPNARLTVEQQVSNNVTLTYITNLTQSAQQVIQFEYNINSEYTIEGIRDENGVVSFDVLIRKRRK